MSWLAENATAIYVLLVILAAGLALTWRINQRIVFLFYAAGVLALLVLTWLAVNYLPSDRKQLEDNVHAMANAVVDGKVDELLKHVATNFNYKGMTREKLSTLAQESVRANRVREVQIRKFTAAISRADKTAKTSFLATVYGDGEGQYPVRVQADFTLEGEQWKLTTLRFYNPFVDQDREIDLPGIR